MQKITSILQYMRDDKIYAKNYFNFIIHKIEQIFCKNPIITFSKSIFAVFKKLKYFVTIEGIRPPPNTIQAMSTIEINTTFETAVKTMLNKHATDAVKTLAEKFEFDLEEALAHLDLGSARVTKKAAASKSKPEPKAKTKAKSKDKEEKSDKEKKPRKPSGYQAFMKNERPTVKSELQDLSMEELATELELEEIPEKFHPKHVMTALGQRWKALSDEERAEWVEQATSSEGED